MIKVLVKRIAKKPNYTIGKLFINGVFFANTLEDTDRGLTQNMSEDEIKKKIGRSPDYSDALMMRIYFEVDKYKGKYFVYQSKNNHNINKIIILQK